MDIVESDIYAKCGITHDQFVTYYRMEGFGYEFTQYYMSNGSFYPCSCNEANHLHANDAIGYFSLLVSLDESQPDILRWNVTSDNLQQYVERINNNPSAANLPRYIKFSKTGSFDGPSDIYVGICPSGLNIPVEPINLIEYTTGGLSVTQSQQSGITADPFMYSLSCADIVNEVGISLNQFETNYSYDGNGREFNQFYLNNGTPTAVTSNGSATDALGTISLLVSLDEQQPSIIRWTITANELAAYAAKIGCDPSRANVVRILRFVKKSGSTLPASQYPTYIYVMLTPASFTVDVQEPEPDCPPLFLTYNTGSLRVTNSPYTGITAYPFDYNHNCADIVNEVGISQSLFESNYSYDGAAREFNQFYLKDGVPTAVTSNGSATDVLGTISLLVSLDEQQPSIIRWSITDYELAAYAAKIGCDPSRANVVRILRFVKKSGSTLPASQYPTYIYVMLSPESFTISQGTMGYGVLHWDNEYNKRNVDNWYAKNSNTPASGFVEIHARTLSLEDTQDIRSKEWTGFADSLTTHLPDVFTKGTNTAGVLNKLITPTNAAYDKFVTIKGTTEISGKDLKLNLVFVDSTYKSQTFKGNDGVAYKLEPIANGKAMGAYVSTYTNWMNTPVDKRDTIAIMYFDQTTACAPKDSINHWQIGYRNNRIAKALLNYKASNELADDVVNVVVGVKATYNNINVPMTNNTFDIRFLRPINAYSNDISVETTALQNEVAINLRDMVRLIDWRDIPFRTNYWDYYAIRKIEVVGANSGGNLADCPDILTNYGNDVNTEPTRTLSEVSDKVRFMYYPSTANYETNGAIVYKNLGATKQPFKIRVPIKVTYLWGEVFCSVDILVTYVNTDVITVENTHGILGETATIAINLDNESEDFTAYQLDIALPSGITLAKNNKDMFVATLSDRYEDNKQNLSITKVNNNTYRVVCFSLQSKRITGNSGAVLDLTLQLDEDITPGTYEGRIENVVFTKTDGTQVSVNNTSFSIATKKITKGDANDDGVINVSDIVEVVNYILNKPSDRFVVAAGDVNKDGEINVTDIVLIVKMIMSYGVNNSRSIRNLANAVPGTDNLFVNDVTMKPDEEKMVNIILNNPNRKYVAFQFDVKLPDGLSIVNDANGDPIATINEDRIVDHSYNVYEIEPGVYRFLTFSMSNAELLGNEGTIVQMKLKADPSITTGTHSVIIKSQVFTDADANQYKWEDFSFSVAIKEPEPIVVTANNYTRSYGDNNPSFSYNISDNSVTGVPSIICNANTTSPVGTYPIIISKGTINSDNVTFTNGTLTITKAPLTVKAEDAQREQGVENPQFVLTYTGWKNGETESVFVTMPIATTTGTKDSPVGVYDIVVSGGEAVNYELNYVSGKLTVTLPSGIEEQKCRTPFDVYDLSGRRVRHQITSSKNLKKGVYIVGSRKVVIR